MIKNPYLAQARENLPRLLALFDTDRSSASFGLGDRYYWAWGLIDFPNGTFQGAAHGMALLWKHGLWCYPTRKESFIRRIDMLFTGAERATNNDGSLEESFPKEGSFCVTALVAFDLLNVIELLDSDINLDTKHRWLKIIEPMIGFLHRHEETHALISNHLATAVAALVRWNILTNDEKSNGRASNLLERILKHQSKEGWFKEYEGADPGYQSLCTYYLADVLRKRPGWNLIEPLRRSVKYLCHFAHPDGSFGGIYGSRCTRCYYPAGIEMLADKFPEAAALSNFMGKSVQYHSTVSLATMDEPNLVPMFNAYCLAATLYRDRKVDEENQLPCLVLRDRIEFPLAGIVIDGGARHYSIVNTHKGGAVMHFRDKKLEIQNAGVIIKNAIGKLGSSQGHSPEKNTVTSTQKTLVIKAYISPMPKRLPRTIDFIFLRILGLSFFRIPKVREWVKKFLVHILITRKAYWPVYNVRKIDMGLDLTIHDSLTAPSSYQKVSGIDVFVPIHMSSQGYWQMQDEEQ